MSPPFGQPGNANGRLRVQPLFLLRYRHQHLDATSLAGHDVQAPAAHHVQPLADVGQGGGGGVSGDLHILKVVQDRPW